MNRYLTDEERAKLGIWAKKQSKIDLDILPLIEPHIPMPEVKKPKTNEEMVEEILFKYRDRLRLSQHNQVPNMKSLVIAIVEVLRNET